MLVFQKGRTCVSQCLFTYLIAQIICIIAAPKVLKPYRLLADLLGNPRGVLLLGSPSLIYPSIGTCDVSVSNIAD